MISRKALVAFAAALFLAMTFVPAVFAQRPDRGDRDIRHVLLISIDGMHALDYINCSQGISGVNGGVPYCPHLAALGLTGVNYLDNSASRPSDSFPGLTAIVSGSSARTSGAFYDVAYDRVLAPPTIDTGNGVAGTGPAGCTPGVAKGTTTEYDEGIDLDQKQVNGGAPLGDGGIASIDPLKLPRDPFQGCNPVYPWNFVRTNTIFGVAHAAGLYTAWSDKHPSYSSVSGPGPGFGANLDDYYSPEINSIPVALPGVSAVNINTGSNVSCNPLPDQTAVTSKNAWTDSFANIQCYDQLKVNAILNEIDGRTHDGAHAAPVPAIFGMNFQVVSVGQKLIEHSLSLTGGYTDAEGRPTPSMLDEISFADSAIGRMVEHLQAHGLLESTLIVITAKHGQSPIDSPRYLGETGSPISTSPTEIADAVAPGCVPFSESPSNPTGIGPTQDDVSLVWLDQTVCTTDSVISAIETTSPSTNNVAGIGEIFAGSAITQLFNAPAVPPNGDSRTPDIIVTPNIGVTYSGSSKKQAEHGGFAHDDVNVMLLLSNPRFEPKTVTSPVETAQVAPTILAVLGLDPDKLDGVRREGTQVLPGLRSDGSR